MLYKGSFLSSLHALARWLMGWNVFQFGGKKLQNWNVWRMSAQVFLSQNVVQHIWKEKNKVNLQAQKIKVSSNDVSTKSLGSISQQLPFWKNHMEPENDHLEKQTSISKFQPLVLHGVTWLVLHKEWGKETSNRSFPNRGGGHSLQIPPASSPLIAVRGISGSTRHGHKNFGAPAARCRREKFF